jgi:putative ABC transport system ATP-binding protein
MTFALQTNEVRKVYESGSLRVVAVKDVSIAITPGDFCALVGPSGSGKTTLLAMLAGLLNPSAGNVVIAGKDMSQLTDRQRTAFRRENIGFTFQANNLVPYLTALENVELMLKLNKRNGKNGRKKAKDMLVRLGLEDRLNNLPSQLSGGQRQRVAIARSLIHSPSVVLADEPTASLDTERAYQVVETFRNLIHEQKRAGIMVTHDLRLVQYVDKVIQMVDGKVFRIIQDKETIAKMAGTSQYIMEEPRTMPEREKSQTPRFGQTAPMPVGD